MTRDELTRQVKEKYASLASMESRENAIQSTDSLTPEAYYEKLLSAVLTEISKGTFDSCYSGEEIVDLVALDKSVLSEWNG